VAYIEKLAGETHLALVRGDAAAGDSAERGETLVRVHEPLSLLDLLDTASGEHSWTVHDALATIAENERGGVLVLLNCSESAGQLLERVASPGRRGPAKNDLLTYGIGAQILRDLGVRRMRLMAAPRKMPSMAGFGLEVVGYLKGASDKG
jgi:3,4-dihydroxy 2-butanone 4-phosphate synthase/GTP cyclohydrolase II